MFLYCKIDIIFRSYDLEGPMFIFNPGKVITITLWLLHMQVIFFSTVLQKENICLVLILYSGLFICKL